MNLKHDMADKNSFVASKVQAAERYLNEDDIQLLVVADCKARDKDKTGLEKLDWRGPEKPEPVLPNSPPKEDRVLLGSPTEFDVCICRSAGTIFRLIATRPDTEELFLNITLNHARYTIKSTTWHEIESSQFGRKKTVVLNFKTNTEERKESFHRFFNDLLNILHNQTELARVAVFYPPGYNYAGLLSDEGIKPKFTFQSLPEKVMETMALSRENVHAWVTNLVQAIEDGQVDEAKNMAAVLAKQKVKVQCEVLQPVGGNTEAEFSVKVCVEDKESSGGSISLKVRPSDTVALLKKRIERDYGFPQGIQKWVIGRRIPRDEDMLKNCGVKAAGSTIFLYLVSCRSVGLTKEAFKQRQQGSGSGAHGDDDQNAYMSMDHFTRQAVAGARPIPGGPLTPQPALPTRAAGQPVTGHTRDKAPPLPANPPPPLSTSHGARTSQQETPQPTQTRETPMVMALNDTFVAVEAMLGAESEGQGDSAQGLSQGWTCPKCTYINIPTRPGCEICSESRPQDYQVPPNFRIPEDEQARLDREHQLDLQAQTSSSDTPSYREELYDASYKGVEYVGEYARYSPKAQRRQEELEQESSRRNYQELLDVEEHDLIANPEQFDCPICFDVISPGQGVILRECLHSFCRDCLAAAVQFTDEAALKCPYQDDNYSCLALLQEREVRALVEREVFERYLQRGLQTAESQAANSYHCKTTDCPGWCVYDDFVNFFDCPVCRKQNCLTCKAIHEGMNCKHYQQDLQIRAGNDTAARQTHVVLQELLMSGEAMHCPTCQVIVQKKEGCDWVCCSICKTEICWVTKGPRWGPNGEGDTSGGCGCRVNNEKCHPDCTNCH